MAVKLCAASIFDLPLYDILFPRIFCYLDAWEVWRIRTVSTRFCRTCWEYFRTALTNLCVDLSVCESEDAVAPVSARLTAAIEIARDCQQLKKFSVHLTSFICTRVIGKRDIENLLMVVAAASPQLQHLHISGLESLQLSLSVTRSLGQCCSQLTELELWNIEPDGTVFDSVFKSILDQPILTLDKLSLKSVKFYEQDTLCKSSVKFPNLRNLTVINSTVNSQVYEEVFKSLHRLEVVDLRYCITLDERAILILIEFCSMLKELYLDKTNIAYSLSPKLMKSIQSHMIHVDIPLNVNDPSSYIIVGQI